MRTRARWVVIAVAMAMAGAPCLARASSWAGVRIEIGKLTLEIFYSVALDYDAQSRAIRDPSAVLFSLAALIQANPEAFAAIDHSFMAELSMREGSSEVTLDVDEDIYEAPGKEFRHVSETTAGPDLAAQVVAAVCARYPSACGKPPLPRVTLHECRKALCAGQISFGSFPSTSLNRRFALLPPKVGAKGIVVTRDRMQRYFEPLD